MKFYRRWVLTLLSVVTTATYAYGQSTSKPTRQPLFAVRLTDVAITQMPGKLTGYFFTLSFSEKSCPSCRSYPRVSYYEVVDGDTLDRGGLGFTQTQDFIRQLDAVGFENFDFNAEAEAAEAAIRVEVEKRIRPPFVEPDDGAEYEIAFKYKQADFSIKRWNPGYCLVEYARYNPRIAKLFQVINLFASYYGRSRFGL